MTEWVLILAFCFVGADWCQATTVEYPKYATLLECKQDAERRSSILEVNGGIEIVGFTCYREKK